MKLNGVKAFPVSGIRVTDPYVANSFAKEVSYLCSLDTARLLAGFRETAGLDTLGAVRYPGWENTTIGGHTIGHYMTACANAYLSANAEETDRAALLEKLSELADGLKACQDNRGSGFIFGATILDEKNIELQFDNVEKGKCEIFTEAWVPWYTMHKILEGLFAMATLTTYYPDEKEAVDHICRTAGSVLVRLTSWVCKRVFSWTDEVRATVIKTEFGGMNDILYKIAAYTGSDDAKRAAARFDDIDLYESIAEAGEGSNVLSGLHANTTIPKITGALRRYTLTGEIRFLEYAKCFWRLVTKNHTYITGDNSEWEHFKEDNTLNAHRTNCNCETCNAYNMLKLTELLFEVTGSPFYMDYAERTYYNTILSSQNPETGMTTYFQPMAGGYFKCYGEPFTKFWCCTGTGMENFSQPGAGYYYYRDDLFVICDYISACAGAGDIGIIVESGIPENDRVTVTFKRPFSGTLALRLPEWLAADAVIKIDGEEYDYAVEGLLRDRPNPFGGAFALIAGPFDEECVIELTLPMQLRAHVLPDADDTVAFSYGPVVLSAGLGRDNMITTTTGVDVTVPEKSLFPGRFLPSHSETVYITDGALEELKNDPASFFERQDEDGRLAFVLKRTNASLIFTAHYMRYSDRYGLYFKFTDEPFTDECVCDGEAEEQGSFADEGGAYDGEREEAARQLDALLHLTRAELKNSTGSDGTEDNSADRHAGAYGRPTEREQAYENDAVRREASTSEQRSRIVPSVSASPSEAARRADEIIARERERRQSDVDRMVQEASASNTTPGIRSVICGTGAIYSSALRNCYVLRVPEYDEFTGAPLKEVFLDIGLNCEGGYVEIDHDMIEKDRIGLKINNSRYTGHLLRLFDDDCVSRKETFVIIAKVGPDYDNDRRGAGDEVAKADACGEVRGSFAGEMCYILDASGKAKADCGTYNSVRFQDFTADPETGYLWGIVATGNDSENRYDFEVENGTYEVNINMDIPDWISEQPCIYQNYMLPGQRIIGDGLESMAENVSYKVRVTDGMLRLSIISEEHCVTAWRIEVRSMQTTAVEADYQYISGIDPEDTDDDTDISGTDYGEELISISDGGDCYDEADGPYDDEDYDDGYDGYDDDDGGYDARTDAAEDYDIGSGFRIEERADDRDESGKIGAIELPDDRAEEQNVSFDMKLDRSEDTSDIGRMSMNGFDNTSDETEMTADPTIRLERDIELSDVPMWNFGSSKKETAEKKTEANRDYDMSGVTAKSGEAKADAETEVKGGADAGAETEVGCGADAGADDPEKPEKDARPRIVRIHPIVKDSTVEIREPVWKQLETEDVVKPEEKSKAVKEKDIYTPEWPHISAEAADNKEAAYNAETVKKAETANSAKTVNSEEAAGSTKAANSAETAGSTKAVNSAGTAGSEMAANSAETAGDTEAGTSRIRVVNSNPGNARNSGKEKLSNGNIYSEKGERKKLAGPAKISTSIVGGVAGLLTVAGSLYAILRKKD